MTTSGSLDGAACAGMRTDVFYSYEHSREGIYRKMLINQATRICAGCPVRAPCLAYAMANENYVGRYGIWGGLTAAERTSLSRRRRMVTA